MPTTKPCEPCGGTGKIPVGATMRALRERSGIEQQKLAKLLGVSKGYLCDLESDRRHWTHELGQRYLKTLKNGAAE